MAINYNLQSVLSDNDAEFVNEILTLFVTEVPDDLMQIKEGIKRKTKHAYAYAHKIKPTRSNGFERRFEEILQIEAWTK
jgi:HPt (histidine-containing phosphotransfer) domain-containing protein